MHRCLGETITGNGAELQRAAALEASGAAKHRQRVQCLNAAAHQGWLTRAKVAAFPCMHSTAV